MSPTYNDDEAPHDIPGFGVLGESALDYEKRRLRELREQNARPMTPEERERAARTARELVEREESLDDRSDIIAQMAAGRAPAAVRAYNRGEVQGGPPRMLNPGAHSPLVPDSIPPAAETTEWHFDEELQQLVPGPAPQGRSMTVREEPRIYQPPSTAVALGREEVQSLVAFEMKEAFGGIRRQIADIAIGIEEQNRLMRHIDAPMEAITGAHERAAASFETLRRDILGGGMDKLEKVLDVSGLTQQATKTEQRLEAMMNRLEKKIDDAFAAHAGDMIKILNLLARLQARELRETQRRAEASHANPG